MPRLLFPATSRDPLPEGPAPLLVIGLMGGEAQGPHSWANRLTEVPAFRVPGSGSRPAPSLPLTCLLC